VAGWTAAGRLPEHAGADDVAFAALDLNQCGRRTRFLRLGLRPRSLALTPELALGERGLRPQPRDLLELLDEPAADGTTARSRLSRRVPGS
jgi:hypothetical protein